MSGSSDMLQFFGRLHPLFVHLPIALILLIAILEVLARFPKFKQANGNAGVILAITLPAVLGTILFGWLLSLSGGYDAHLLQWHKWTGFATAGACALTALCYWFGRKQLYYICLFGSLVVLVVASHYGGSLTHGSDYLTRYAPGPLKTLLGAGIVVASKPAEPAVYGALIQPLLNDKCVECHGPDKSKGGLRLDSFEALAKGGKSGPVILPGNSAESPAMQRIHLPEANDDHMPPEGKTQLESDEIALLQWWIDGGASPQKKVAELKPPPAVARLVAVRLGNPASVVKSAAPKPLPEIIDTSARLADELGIILSILSPNEPWLQGNARLCGTNFGDAELARLAPLGPNLRWLDLGGTGVTDTGLSNLAAMPNLTRLHLERTAITDAGLEKVAVLSNLEYLNLCGTAITDAGLKCLQGMPALKQVYLGQTTPGQTSTDAADR